MKLRWAYHLLFWLGFSVLYTLVRMAFAPPTELEFDIVTRFSRYWLSEAAFLPFKAAPFYFLFYFLIPQFLSRKKTFITVGLLLTFMIICVIIIRWLTSYVSFAMYGDYPAFETFSPGRMLYSFTEIIPAFSLSSTIKLIKQWNENQKKSNTLQQEKLTAELQYLKSQTNPHFLFNTLNNLYGLARTGSEHTAPAIMKLSHLFRYILEECREPFIPISKEVELIKSYLELETLRYDRRLSLVTNFHIDNDEILITPMILLPLVENAFKHGASESMDNAYVHISLTAYKNKINFEIKNSVDPNHASASNLGLGLKNVKRQLELIYPKKHEIITSENEGEFSLTLSIIPGAEKPNVSRVGITESNNITNKLQPNSL